jgi:tetratricopeptide (TPR) repeat protein
MSESIAIKPAAVDINSDLAQTILDLQAIALDLQRSAIADHADAGPAVDDEAIDLHSVAAALQKHALHLKEMVDPVRSVLRPELFYQAGVVAAADERFEKAAGFFRRALQLRAEYPEAHKGLGDVLLRQGAPEDAIAHYRQALALSPGLHNAENNLAVALLGVEAYGEAQSTFRKILERDYGLPAFRKRHCDLSGSVQGGRSVFASPFKLTDRIDQLSYLIDIGKLDNSFGALVHAYRELLSELSADTMRVPYRPLKEDVVARFGGYYDRLINFEDVWPSPTGALNPALPFADLEEQYMRTRMLYFDQFLTPEALCGLRKFFLESTVFFGSSEAGFVGSYLRDGFNCSLIFQLIADLKRKFPRILQDRPLNNMWCYRYAHTGPGVRPHAGDGSVTFNFWITQDEANLDPGGGGMVMYDKEHPDHWDRLTFNARKDEPEIQAQISDYLHDAGETRIPYRCNRAVLFHSTLLHKTDPFDFRDNYVDRRMNITMLFGRRGQESIGLK